MNKSAVILFANSPETDAKLKIHSSSPEIVSLVAECFQKSILHISRKIIADKIFSFLVSSPDASLFKYLNTQHDKIIFQKGNTFGERFYNSINTAFHKGFKRITIIGNDTTVIKKKNIKKALKFAEAGKVCVGPSSSGGFYLFSISKNDFKKISKKNFTALSYQTETVFIELIKLLKQTLLSVQLLERKKYFNCSNKLLVVRQFKKVMNLIRLEIIKNIFSRLENNFVKNIFIVTHSSDYQISFRKAPPL